MAFTATNIAAAALELYDKFEDTYADEDPELIPERITFSRTYEDTLLEREGLTPTPATVITVTIAIPCVAAFDTAAGVMTYEPIEYPISLTFPAP